MRLYEYEAKRLLSGAGVPCPDEHVVTSPAEAEAVLAGATFPVVIKAQVLTGGRGKAGGVKFADDASSAREAVEALLSTTIRGYPVRAVLVAPKLDVASELYLGVTVDRKLYTQTVMASATGGVDIEAVARENPDAVVRCDLRPDQPFYGYLGVSLGRAIGLRGAVLRRFAAVARTVVELYRRRDARLLEINPLVVTRDGDLVAADARMSIDDDALFRQPDLAGMGLADRHEEGERTERERQAREWGIPYLDLDGDIGMFPGGAGFGIMGNDFVFRFGGRPANFMDSGGGPSPERIARMLVLLDENPRVRVIFGARFGGISRCDDFARGVIRFLREHGLSKPLVMRMTGNMWQEGVRLFDEARRESPELFRNVVIHGIETPIEHVVREAVEKAAALREREGA